MSVQLVEIKIYTVAINHKIKATGRWYNSKRGELFKVYLTCKNTYMGFQPVFRVCQVIGKTVHNIEMVLDIRPEDCSVKDENIFKCNFVINEYQLS